MRKTKMGGWEAASDGTFELDFVPYTISQNPKDPEPFKLTKGDLGPDAYLSDYDGSLMLWDHIARGTPFVGSKEQVSLLRQNRYGYVAALQQESFCIRFLINKGQSVADVLYKLEFLEPELPAGMFAMLLFASELPFDKMILAMDSSIPLLQTAPQTAGFLSSQLADALQDAGMRDDGAERMSRKELEKFIPPGSFRAPIGKTNRARWLLMLTQQAFSNVLDYLARLPYDPADRRFEVMDSMARISVALYPDKAQFRIGGETFKATPDESISIWNEAMMWIKAGKPDVAKFYKSLRPSPDPNQVDYEMQPIDVDLVLATCKKLIADAEENRLYALAGKFLIDVPSNLTDWRDVGITRFAVYAESEGLWFAPIFEDGSRGTVVYWDPDDVTTFLATADMFPHLAHMSLALAALWHDLSVGGTDLVVERGRKATGTSQPARRSGQSAKRKSEPTVELPRRHSVYMTGTRSWSDDEDHQRIRRTATLVKRLMGFPRRLHEGWKRGEVIQKFIDDNGLAVPDEYTYVRPISETGSAEHVEIKPVVARARGLQTISLLLNQQQAD